MRPLRPRIPPPPPGKQRANKPKSNTTARPPKKILNAEGTVTVITTLRCWRAQKSKIFLKKIFCRFVSPGRCSLPRYRKEGVTHGREKRSAKSSRL
nr:MAG TPA: hypothetical protein [Caudoviricetes sp.]